MVRSFQPENGGIIIPAIRTIIAARAAAARSAMRQPTAHGASDRGRSSLMPGFYPRRSGGGKAICCRTATRLVFTGGVKPTLIANSRLPASAIFAMAGTAGGKNRIRALPFCGGARDFRTRGRSYGCRPRVLAGPPQRLSWGRRATSLRISRQPPFRPGDLLCSSLNRSSIIGVSGGSGIRFRSTISASTINSM